MLSSSSSLSDKAAKPKDITVLVSVCADRCRYECASDAVVFHPTMMFRTRTFKLPLRNTSTIRLQYAWSIVPEEGEQSDEVPFRIR